MKIFTKNLLTLNPIINSINPMYLYTLVCQILQQLFDSWEVGASQTKALNGDVRATGPMMNVNKNDKITSKALIDLNILKYFIFSYKIFYWCQ